MAAAGSAIQYPDIELIDFSKRVLVKRYVYVLEQAEQPALTFRGIADNEKFAPHLSQQHSLQLQIKKRDGIQVTRKDLASFPKLAAVLEAHAFGPESEYLLQLHKVVGCTCPLCAKGLLGAPRHPDFNQLQPCPLPMERPAAPGQPFGYKPLQEVLGSPTDNSCQPSLQQKQQQAAAAAGIDPCDQAHSELLVLARRRGVLTCCSCSKPRLWYSEVALSKMTKAQRQEVEAAIAEKHWACGAPLLFKGKTAVVRQGIDCSDSLEAQGYQGQVTSWDSSLCCRCGQASGEVDQLLSEQYEGVLPLCSSCKQQGCKPAWRRARNKRIAAGVKKRRKAGAAQAARKVARGGQRRRQRQQQQEEDEEEDEGEGEEEEEMLGSEEVAAEEQEQRREQEQGQGQEGGREQQQVPRQSQRQLERSRGGSSSRVPAAAAVQQQGVCLESTSAEDTASDEGSDFEVSE